MEGKHDAVLKFELCNIKFAVLKWHKLSCYFYSSPVEVLRKYFISHKSLCSSSLRSRTIVFNREMGTILTKIAGVKHVVDLCAAPGSWSQVLIFLNE